VQTVMRLPVAVAAAGWHINWLLLTSDLQLHKEGSGAFAGKIVAVLRRSIRCLETARGNCQLQASPDRASKHPVPPLGPKRFLHCRRQAVTGETGHPRVKHGHPNQIAPELGPASNALLLVTSGPPAAGPCPALGPGAARRRRSLRTWATEPGALLMLGVVERLDAVRWIGTGRRRASSSWTGGGG